MRLSLSVAVGSVILCFLLGIVLGFFAGYYGGWIDILLSRIVDVFLTFPSIFLVILSLALFGGSLLSVILVLGLSGWMGLYKIVKGEVISIKNKDYFLTAKKIGLNKRQLLVKEIFPVIASPVIVNLLLQFSSVILAESALSYLGLGVGLNYPSLGSMINSGQEYFTMAWWLSVFPCITIIGIILIFNSIGERINAKLNSRMAR
jgi:peptide/nickel transport system permease protein